MTKQSNIKYFSPSWYYHGTPSEENKTKIKELFVDFVTDDKNFRSAWDDCDNLTSYKSPTNSDVDWDKFFSYIRPNIQEFFDHMNPKVQDLSVNYLGSWVNKYRKGDHQEVHNHADLNCNLVMVYIYESQSNNCFKFYDPDCYEHKFRLDNCFNFLYSPKITPNLNSGDVIIFPSYYHHMVSPNRSDDERITISANLFVEPRESAS